MPGSEEIEIVLGKDQPEYIPLPAVYLDNSFRPMITRWGFTPEERTAIAMGADIVLTQLTFGAPFNPIHLQVTLRDQMPQLVGE